MQWSKLFTSCIYRKRNGLCITKACYKLTRKNSIKVAAAGGFTRLFLQLVAFWFSALLQSSCFLLKLIVSFVSYRAVFPLISVFVRVCCLHNAFFQLLMVLLDFNLLYIKSQFTGNMNALNSHSDSFPHFRKRSREHRQSSSPEWSVHTKARLYYLKINVQQLLREWKYYIITWACW